MRWVVLVFAVALPGCSKRRSFAWPKLQATQPTARNNLIFLPIHPTCSSQLLQFVMGRHKPSSNPAATRSAANPFQTQNRWPL